MTDTKISKSKNLHQKLLMVYHDDGILDLVVGITVLMLAAVMASVFFIGLIGIPLIFYVPIKDQLSTPRIGLIRFERKDTTRKRMIFFLWLGIGIFILFFLLFFLREWALPELKQMLWNNEILIFAILLGGTLFVAGRVLNNARFDTYALIALGLVLGANFTGLRVWLPVAIVGLVMEVIGIFKLVNFLRKYPLNGA